MILTLFYRLLGRRSGLRQAVPLLVKILACVCKQNTRPGAASAHMGLVLSPAGEVIVGINRFIPGT